MLKATHTPERRARRKRAVVDRVKQRLRHKIKMRSQTSAGGNKVDNHELVPLPSPTAINVGSEADVAQDRTGRFDRNHSERKRYRLPSPSPNDNDNQTGYPPLKRMRKLVRDQNGDLDQEDNWSGDGGVPAQGWRQRWLCHAVPWVRWFFSQLKWVRWFFPPRTFPRGTYFVGLGTPRM